jgi:ketosteroid isomerase-like protein
MEAAITMKPLDVVQSFYQALGRGEAFAALAVLDDAVQWTEAEGFPYSSGTWTGPQAVFDKLLVPLGRDWDGFSAKPESFVVEGTAVVAFGTYRGRFKSTGKELVAPFAHRWEMTSGKATSFRQYTDTALVQAAII